MKLISDKLTLWVNRRFIHIVEVLGYTASAIMGVGVIYCFVTYQDVLAHAGGFLVPVARSVTVSDECVVHDWLIEPGGDVTADAPIGRVVTDRQAAQRLLAARHLARARDRLDQAGGGAEGAMGSVNDALEDLDEPPTTRTVLSPIGGVVVTHEGPDGTALLAPGTALATTYDLATLSCTAVLERIKAKEVAAGQIVRVTLDGVEEPLEGRVIGKPEPEEGGTIEIRFEQVPQDAQSLFREMLSAEPAAFPEVRAAVVVGRQSLFVKLFGRSA